MGIPHEELLWGVLMEHPHGKYPMGNTYVEPPLWKISHGDSLGESLWGFPMGIPHRESSVEVPHIPRGGPVGNPMGP